MIDLEFFEKYLNSKNNGFIDINDKITKEAISFFRKRKSQEYKELFKKFTKEQLKQKEMSKFLVEVICNKCGKTEEIRLSKTNLFNYIAKGDFTCTKCSEVLKNEYIEQEKAKKIQREKEKPVVIQNYIYNYLNPEKEWKDNISLYEKMSSISQNVASEETIFEHIRNMEYLDFLKTPYWKAIAQQSKKKAGYRCELCGSNKNLITHHKTYEHHGKEHLYWKQDLICLCENCHKKFHFD